MTIHRFAALLLLIAAGCAQQQYRWEHETADQKQFNRDQSQCEYEATASTQQTDYSYRTGFGQELDRAMRKADLRVLCMKAKGYIQQPLSK